MPKPTSLFGRIAQKKGLVSEVQLERALRFQEEISALGLSKPLGQILVADGILAEGQVEVILRLQALNQRASEARRFGRVAVRNGFVTQRQFDEALVVSGEEGYQRPLSMVLQAQGALEGRIARAIDQALDRVEVERQMTEVRPSGVTGRISRSLDLSEFEEEDEEAIASNQRREDLGFAAVAFREGLVQIPELERAMDELALLEEPIPLAQVLSQRGVLSVAELDQVRQALESARAETLTVPGYEWLDVLGYGVTSVVIKARHTVLEREVAIKLFREEHVKATSAEALVEEARAVAKIRHANVVGVHEVGRVRRRIYFVMELVEGPTLLDRIRNEGAMRERAVLELGRDLARALRAIHAEGLVHRDVKPQNILFTQDGLAKLTDLGLVCEQGAGVTDHGIFGSPYTISPEAANGQAVDARADLYGLGATLFYALTESPPFDGRDTLTILMAHMTAPIPDPRERGAQISDDASKLVRRLLAKEAAHRFQSCDELLASLEGLLAF